jgi:hydroxyethylthiazole kinase-like uncharacterized protein yjeF
MRIVTTTEMKEIETLAEEQFLFSERLIIENVGLNGARAIINRFSEDFFEYEFIFLIGKGNNGADGLAIARHLSLEGFRCRAFMLFDEGNWTEELKYQHDMLTRFGVVTNFINEPEEIVDFMAQLTTKIVTIDAIFGTGINLPLSNKFYDIISHVNDYSDKVIAIDIPTGVEGDTGFIQGNSILADLTLAVGLPKLGYYIADGLEKVGEVEVIDAGIPKSLIEEGDKYLLNLELLIDKASKRNKFADKKTFGHSLVIGGSHGLTGALVLASSASLKVGAGLVTAATWEPQYQELISRLIPEVMTGYIPLDVNKWPRLIRDLEKYDSIVIGPGLARSTRSRRLVIEILNNFSGPVVIDADAINVLNLEDDDKIFAMRNAPTILTPHMGEMARFTGIEYDEIKRKPVHYLKQLVERINCSVLLKGPCTYLGFPDGSTFFSFFPNDGMATGGVGDVLAGMLGGLLGQEQNLKDKQSLFNRYENFNKTVCLTVLLHSVAGQVAASNKGVRPMSARNIIDAFSKVFNDIDSAIEELTSL